jgi:hypothetical protein
MRSVIVLQVVLALSAQATKHVSLVGWDGEVLMESASKGGKLSTLEMESFDVKADGTVEGHSSPSLHLSMPNGSSSSMLELKQGKPDELSSMLSLEQSSNISYNGSQATIDLHNAGTTGTMFLYYRIVYGTATTDVLHSWQHRGDCVTDDQKQVKNDEACKKKVG